MKNSILPLALFFALASCQKEDQPYNPGEGNYLVTYTTETTGSLIPEIEEVTTEKNFTYTPDGWLFKEVHRETEVWMGKDKSIHQLTYEHQYSNGLPSQTICSSLGMTHNTVSYDYNANRQLIRKTTVNQGNANPSYTDAYSYQGNRLQTHTQTTQHEDGDYYRIETYTYSGNQVVVTRNDYRLVNNMKANENQSVRTYTMTQDGAVASEVEIDLLGNVLTTTYEYDQNPNFDYYNRFYKTTHPESFLNPEYAPHNIVKHTFLFKNKPDETFYEYTYFPNGFPKLLKKKIRGQYLLGSKEFRY